LKQTQTIPETFLGVGYTRDRAGLPLEAVRVPVPRPAADQVLIRVAASSLNPLEYKLADLNFMGRTPTIRSHATPRFRRKLPISKELTSAATSDLGGNGKTDGRHTPEGLAGQAVETQQAPPGGVA